MVAKEPPPSFYLHLSCRDWMPTIYNNRNSHLQLTLVYRLLSTHIRMLLNPADDSWLLVRVVVAAQTDQLQIGEVLLNSIESMLNFLQQ